LFEAGETGQSLGDLLRQPTPLILFTAAGKQPGSGDLQIQFKSLGGWQTFRLLRASGPGSPFLPVLNLTPTALGNGEYRFDYPSGTNGVEYFRIEGQ
jgi:hypothetical protein